MSSLLVVLAFLALVLLALCVCCARCARCGAAVGGAAGAWESDDGDFTGGGTFRLRLRDPGYTYALEGKKTVEARPDKAPFSRLKAGDEIVVARSRPQGDTAEYAGERRFAARVAHVKPYPNIGALLDGEGVKAYAPRADKGTAAELFREFTGEAEEKEHGLVAIAFARRP